MQHRLDNMGVVVIGRNEGERLKRCLYSVKTQSERIIYVDSGSTDGSIEFAKFLGVDVVELDMSRPFTMARGRNAGFERLLEINPSIELVQFIDGDCELVDGYLDAATHSMHERPDITVVTGRRVERHPDASIYNRLCDIEWGREIGEIQSCGGDMMVRVDAFRAVGMFNPGMIAGEEPELCVRLRKAGGKILRVDHHMTVHDADMHTFRQWWKRAMRGGHACAEGAAIHGWSPERHKMREVRSTLLWGSVVPVLAVICAVVGIWWPLSLVGSVMMIAAYIVLAIKIARYMRGRGFGASDARLYAISCILGKFPGLLGIFQYWLNRLSGRKSELIEYKQA